MRTRAFHRMLVNGVTVDHHHAEGDIRRVQAKDMDFDDSDSNDKGVCMRTVLETLEVRKIRDQIKQREKDLQSDFNKKERDRRLRKLIVDLKKWQTLKEVNSLKEKALNRLLRESKQEEEVRYEFHKAKTFQTIFTENSKLYQQHIEVKQTAIEEQRKSTNKWQFESLQSQLNSTVDFYKNEENALAEKLQENKNYLTY